MRRQTMPTRRTLLALTFGSLSIVLLFAAGHLHAQPCQPHWEALGSGMNSIVNSLLQFDEDGAGGNPPALIAGGYFNIAGGHSAKLIARWNGQAWSPVGNGIPHGGVFALAGFDDDGSGPNPTLLHAGGDLSLTRSYELVDIVRWDGASWSVVGGGIGIDERDYILALETFDDDGAGPHLPALYAGGFFFMAGSNTFVSNLVTWDGSEWSPVGDGVSNDVAAMTVFDDDGPGPNLPALYIGGIFLQADSTTVNSITKFDGQTFGPVGGGVTQGGGNGYIAAMTVFDDDGAGPNVPALIVAGRFTAAGGVSANCIAKWNGTSWSALGSGISAFGENQVVRALATFDEDGAGPNPTRLFAAGKFAIAGGQSIVNLARWDGQQWSKVGSGINDPWWTGLMALAVFDPDGPGNDPGALIAGGFFSSAGGVPVANIAAWVGCEPLAGDATGDGTVNVDDLLAVINAWGPCPSPCDADLDHDGDVDVDDLLVVINNWN